MHRGVAISLALCALGCAGPPPHPPTAVIDAEPSTICAGDAFATPIELSAARSSARLSLVPEPPAPGDPPLDFAWHLDGDAHAIASGTTSSPTITVYAAGERPLHAMLTVRSADGGEATSLFTVGLEECAP